MDVKKLVSEMTLEEKAGMCSGRDFWHTKAVERLGIPSVMVSDGPHGLRKQDLQADHLGVNESIKAVCFPAGCATAASFDRDLIRSMGEALGEECQAEDVAVLLGPGANIKRSPLCGRNFEYFSEDPYLASEMAASQINGVQSKNVGTSLKHFLANNQENRRMSASSEIEERTLREIYLAAFEGAVKKAKPWTVMCSYNRINGVYASENWDMLTGVLREEWGFDGFTVSDWGAVNDRVKGVKAGLDLEMPSSYGIQDAEIIKAVKEGTLQETELDTAVERILNIVFRYVEGKKSAVKWDMEEHHMLSGKIAAESMVLLKNEGILPLKKEQRVAFIGQFAEKPRFQGGGSSHINCFQTVSALEAADGIFHMTYSQGYEVKKDVILEELAAEAVENAKNAEAAVIFAGLPDSFESEGYDRTHMSLPDCQNDLIERIARVQKNTVVVLHNGSPVEMPWIDKVGAVLEVYLGGQAVGSATVKVLYGETNPSGKLAETFPLRLEDNPSYLYYGGEKDTVEYREGIFVGYRYYDKKNMKVLFPFGHGLSYTTFEYSDMQLDTDMTSEAGGVSVSVKVTNTGSVFGKEVVQLYVGAKDSKIIRPVRELKGFEKVALEPGETKTVVFELGKRAFAYYNTQIHDWYVEGGEYKIQIGKSSRQLECEKTIRVEASAVLPEHFTRNSTMGDILETDGAKELLQPLMDVYFAAGTATAAGAGGEGGAFSSAMEEAMFQYMPLRGLISFGEGRITTEQVEEVLKKLNHLK